MPERLGPAGPEQQTFTNTGFEVTPPATDGPEVGSGILGSGLDRLQLTGNNEVGALNLEVMSIGVDRASLAINGLRQRFAMWRLVRSEMSQMSRADTKEAGQESARIYSWAAEASLAKVGLAPADELGPEGERTISVLGKPYNPAQTSYKANRVPRADYSGSRGRIPEGLRDTSREAITASQKRASRRNNRRATKMLDAGGRRATSERLYGSVLHDKDALEAAIKAGRYTRAQARAIRSSGKVVRSSDKTIAKTTDQLMDTVEGRDLPGKVIDARTSNIRYGDGRSMRLARHVNRLEAAARARKVRIAAAQQAREGRKNHRRSRTARSTT